MGFPSPVAHGTNPQAQQQQQEDPMALIMAMLSQPAPDFNTSAQQQAAQMYGPLQNSVNQAGANARKQAGANDQQLAAMYAALQKDIGGQSTNINSAFNSALGGSKAAYTQGQQSIGNNYDQAIGDTAALMARLGIQAAAADPRTIQQQNGQEAFLKSILGVNSQATQNDLLSNRQSSLNFNTASRNAAGAAGTQARSSLTQQLTNRLNELEQQRLQYSAQQSQTAQTLAAQLSQGYAGNQTELAKMMYDAYNNQANRDNDLLRTQISSNTNNSSNTKIGPLTTAFSQAQQLLGNEGQASQAVNIALQVGNAKQYHNAYQYIQAVREEARKQAASDMTRAIPEDALAAVAATVWEELNPQTLSSYMPYGQ
jgi:hypothetical protein